MFPFYHTISSVCLITGDVNFDHSIKVVFARSSIDFFSCSNYCHSACYIMVIFSSLCFLVFIECNSSVRKTCPFFPICLHFHYLFISAWTNGYAFCSLT